MRRAFLSVLAGAALFAFEASPTIAATSVPEPASRALIAVDAADSAMAAATTAPAGTLDSIQVNSVLSVGVAGVTGTRTDVAGGAVFDAGDMKVVARSDSASAQVAIVNAAGTASKVTFKLTSRLGPVKLTAVNGGIQVTDAASGDEIGYVDPPWAKAGPSDVTTSYTITGANTFVQKTSAASGTVVSDPRFSCGIVTCTLYFSLPETRTIADSWAGAAIITALCTAAGGPAVGAGCALNSGSVVVAAKVAINQTPSQCLKVKMTPPYIPPFFPAFLGYYRFSC